jgi:hypothetical protein
MNQPASTALWNKAQSIIIPAGTADVDYWATGTAGGSNANTAAGTSGENGCWAVDALHVNLDVDGTVIVSVILYDTDKTTPLETIPFRFATKGTYVVPVMWKAQTKNKYLAIDLKADGTASVYVRALGVRIVD